MKREVKAIAKDLLKDESIWEVVERGDHWMLVADVDNVKPLIKLAQTLLNERYAKLPAEWRKEMRFMEDEAKQDYLLDKLSDMVQEEMEKQMKINH